MAAASYTSVESLLGRLELIDVRLRQLEEKQREPESYFTAELRTRGKQLPSAVDDDRLRDSLMSRLQLLETRIRQLSHELAKGGGGGGGGGDGWASSSATAAVHAKEESGSTSSPSEKQKLVASRGGGARVVGEPLRASAAVFQSHRSKKKAKDAMQVATTETMEKRAGVLCGNEQRRMERTRLYRRWFPVGC